MSMISYSRIAIVTGSSSGIGRATVMLLAERGFRVYALVRKLADIGVLDSDITSRNLSHLVTTLQLDVNDAAGRTRIHSEILDRENERLYGDESPELILINNAGYGTSGAFEEMSEQSFRDQVETNFFGAVAMTREFLPVMRQLKKGRIIQVSSGFGRIAGPLLSAYCASKFALEGFSESLHYELLAHNVHISLIEPGPVNTEFLANMKKVAVPEGTDYGSIYEKAGGAQEMSWKFASSAADVASMIFEAASARSPRLRYPVGPLAHLTGAAPLVPQPLIDGLFRLFT